MRHAHIGNRQNTTPATGNRLHRVRIPFAKTNGQYQIKTKCTLLHSSRCRSLVFTSQYNIHPLFIHNKCNHNIPVSLHIAFPLWHGHQISIGPLLSLSLLLLRLFVLRVIRVFGRNQNNAGMPMDAMVYACACAPMEPCACAPFAPLYGLHGARSQAQTGSTTIITLSSE